MTWNYGTPGIDPWLRNTLIALQEALNHLSATQVAIAQQVERNTARLDWIEMILRRQS